VHGGSLSCQVGRPAFGTLPAMSFDYEEKPSSSRFVDVFWRTHDTSDGTYLAAADACWDMIFIRSADGTRVLLSGPSSTITPVPYRAGNRNVGIRFVRGSFLTHVPATVMVDTTITLPMTNAESFGLAGYDWPVPTYESVEDFVAGLDARGLLSDDPVVLAVLRGDSPGTSPRSVQRRFSQVTGLTEKRIRTIIRARTAADMLGRGVSILDVTHELGYADQAHLTRELRLLTGYTPGQTKDRGEPI
jgi:Helix-turn-helix domain